MQPGDARLTAAQQGPEGRLEKEVPFRGGVGPKYAAWLPNHYPRQAPALFTLQLATRLRHILRLQHNQSDT